MILTPAEIRARAEQSLCDVVRQLLGQDPQTEDELLPRVHEEWGDCEPDELAHALSVLRSEGGAALAPEGYVRS
jgi:hypothetical protein